MWKGRFAKDTSSLVQQFGESISYDWRLFPHDIAGSIDRCACADCHYMKMNTLQTLRDCLANLAPRIV